MSEPGPIDSDAPDEPVTESTWYQLREYFEAIWPLIAVTSLLTPLGVVTTDVPVPSWAVPLRFMSVDLDPDFLEKHFIFSERAFNHGRYWTLLSHMFLHESHQHLAENMLALLLNGRNVYQSFGMGSLLTVYFSGGMLAALDRKTKYVQLSNAMDSFVNEVVRRVPPQLGRFKDDFTKQSSQHPEISSWMEKTADRVASRVIGYVSPYFGYLGCSAGVSALTGVNLCITLEQICRYGYRLATRREKPKPITVLAHVGRAWLHLEPLMFEYFLFKKGGFSGVDHAGHLSGFSAGVAMYLVLKVARVDSRKGSVFSRKFWRQ